MKAEICKQTAAAKDKMKLLLQEGSYRSLTASYSKPNVPTTQIALLQHCEMRDPTFRYCMFVLGELWISAVSNEFG